MKKLLMLSTVFAATLASQEWRTAVIIATKVHITTRWPHDQRRSNKSGNGDGQCCRTYANDP
jgi:hypothetical protein